MTAEFRYDASVAVEVMFQPVDLFCQMFDVGVFRGVRFLSPKEIVFS